MMQNALSHKATVNIFWAADFKQYSIASEKFYTDIANITNYGIFTVQVAENKAELSTYKNRVR